MLTSDVPKPSLVLPANASTITPPSVLNQEEQPEQDILFVIGLRLLDEKKLERFVAYITSLQHTTEEKTA